MVRLKRRSHHVSVLRIGGKCWAKSTTTWRAPHLVPWNRPRLGCQQGASRIPESVVPWSSPLSATIGLEDDARDRPTRRGPRAPSWIPETGLVGARRLDVAAQPKGQALRAAEVKGAIPGASPGDRYVSASSLGFGYPCSDAHRRTSSHTHAFAGPIRPRAAGK